VVSSAVHFVATADDFEALRMIRARQREARTSKGHVSQSFPILFRLAVYPSHLRKWRKSHPWPSNETVGRLNAYVPERIAIWSMNHSSPVSSQVANITASHHVDNVLGNIGGMIANAFQVFCY